MTASTKLLSSLSGTAAGGGDWTRILNVGGSSTSTYDVSSYSELLVFGTAAGGRGGNGGDDDGGGGGGSGACQLDGKLVDVSAVSTLWYQVPNSPAVDGNTDNPGTYPDNLELRNSSSGGTLLFELESGQNGSCNNDNSTNIPQGGSGGASNSYSSSAGVSGGVGATRLNPSLAGAGSGSAYAAGGGGGGGAWLSSPYNGEEGGDSTVSVSISNAENGDLDVTFTVAGTTGGAQGERPNDGTDVLTAEGGEGSTYGGGGGAGGGLRFFGTGLYYGAGGGAAAGQNSRNGCGAGGSAYLVVYAR